jgi:hypothetical protein
MKVSVSNNGENAIRVIIDKDSINDLTLEAGDMSELESADEGTIELRELGSAEPRDERQEHEQVQQP